MNRLPGPTSHNYVFDNKKIRQKNLAKQRNFGVNFTHWTKRGKNTRILVVPFIKMNYKLLKNTKNINWRSS
jgi:hypothetical protein